MIVGRVGGMASTYMFVAATTERSAERHCLSGPTVVLGPIPYLFYAASRTTLPVPTSKTIRPSASCRTQITAANHIHQTYASIQNAGSSRRRQTEWEASVFSGSIMSAGLESKACVYDIAIGGDV